MIINLTSKLVFCGVLNKLILVNLQIKLLAWMKYRQKVWLIMIMPKLFFVGGLDFLN